MWLRLRNIGKMFVLFPSLRIETLISSLRAPDPFSSSGTLDFLLTWLVIDCLNSIYCTLPASSARLLCPWNSPSKSTGVDGHSLLQGIFLTQILNPSLLHCRQPVYHMSHQEGFISQPRSHNFLSLSCQFPFIHKPFQSTTALMIWVSCLQNSWWPHPEWPSLTIFLLYPGGGCPLSTR